MGPSSLNLLYLEIRWYTSRQEEGMGEVPLGWGACGWEEGRKKKRKVWFGSSLKICSVSSQDPIQNPQQFPGNVVIRATRDDEQSCAYTCIRDHASLHLTRNSLDRSHSQLSASNPVTICSSTSQHRGRAFCRGRERSTGCVGMPVAPTDTAAVVRQGHIHALASHRQLFGCGSVDRGSRYGPRCSPW